MKFTGREERLFFSETISAHYRDWVKNNKVSAGLSAVIPIESFLVPFDANFSSSSDSSEIDKTFDYNTYFHRANTVFAPAVKAWTECVKAVAKGINFRPIMASDSQLQVEVAKKAGTTDYLSIAGFDGANIDCRGSSSVGSLKPNGKKKLPDGPLVVSCKRKAPFKGDVTLSFIFGGETFPLYWPAAAGEPRTINEGNFSVVGFRSTESHQYLEAAPFDREVRPGEITLIGYWYSQNHNNPIGYTFTYNGISVQGSVAKPQTSLMTVLLLQRPQHHLQFQPLHLWL